MLRKMNNMEELNKDDIPESKEDFMTESQVRNLVTESQTNFTEVMRVKKSIIVGDNNVTIDGANKRILINDGTNDRVLIGYDSGGF